jgi:hypothetical protein
MDLIAGALARRPRQTRTAPVYARRALKLVQSTQGPATGDASDRRGLITAREPGKA